MISDYIRLWVISHPWNMPKTQSSRLIQRSTRSQYTSGTYPVNSCWVWGAGLGPDSFGKKTMNTVEFEGRIAIAVGSCGGTRLLTHVDINSGKLHRQVGGYPGTQLPNAHLLRCPACRNGKRRSGVEITPEQAKALLSRSDISYPEKAADTFTG